jgi:hypothetical protein
MSEKKRPRLLSWYTKQLLGVIDQYTAETGDKLPDLHEVAAWGYGKRIIEPPQRDVIKQLARDLARAARQDYIEDENGEPVRRRFSYKEPRGDVQLTFWFKMEDGTPERMRRSAQGRRNGTLMDILQLDRDLRYYNKHHNPGDPIQLSFNFDPDVEEHRLPPDYPQGPPPESPDHDAPNIS